MEIPDEHFQEIIEGTTKLLFQKISLTDKVQPKKPVFEAHKNQHEHKLNQDLTYADNKIHH